MKQPLSEVLSWTQREFDEIHEAVNRLVSRENGAKKSEG